MQMIEIGPRIDFTPAEIVEENVVVKKDLAETVAGHRFPKRPIVQYDLQFDQQAIKNLLNLKATNPEILERKAEEQKSFIDFNIKTAIGERFHAGLSVRRDEIIDEQICDINMHTPLLSMIRNGAEYRAKNGSSASDQKREYAEVIGFEKIQDVLTNRFTPVGTMMLSISPPGEGDSIYKHNFYDVFTLKEDTKGRYIEARRYSSGLEMEEYMNKAVKLQANYFEDETQKNDPFDVYFLAHPIRIAKGIDANSLHAAFHTEHEYLDNTRYEEIIRLCQPFIHAYLEQLLKNPDDSDALSLYFNAILNKADEVADQLEQGIVIRDVFVRATYAEIDRLGKLPVRQVTTGCGLSGSASADGRLISMYGDPFSVMEFSTAKDQFGSLEFECPGCFQKITRPYGKLLSNCTNCGSDKVAC